MVSLEPEGSIPKNVVSSDAIRFGLVGVYEQYRGRRTKVRPKPFENKPRTPLGSF